MHFLFHPLSQTDIEDVLLLQEINTPFLDKTILLFARHSVAVTCDVKMTAAL